MKRNTKIILAILVIILVAVLGFFSLKIKYEKKPEVPNNATSTPVKTTPEKTAPKEITVFPGYKLYKNAEFGFEIQYPQTWIISEKDIENVRGENTKAFYFGKPGSDLRFAILPRDGLSYGLPSNGTSSEAFIGGFSGVQRKWTLPDGRRLWLLNPHYELYNWSGDIGRIDIQSSATDPVGDTIIFQEMLNSFKLSQ